MTLELVQWLMLVAFLAVWILAAQVLVQGRPHHPNRSSSGWEFDRQHHRPARPHFSSTGKLRKQLRS